MTNIRVSSEINTLKKVIIHTPGSELELMTPDTAEELLYDDILNLEAAQEQHHQMSGVLATVAQPLEVKDLLKDVLENEFHRKSLVNDLCIQLDAATTAGSLLELSAAELAERLITGTRLERNTLEKYLSPRQYALPPLPNLFFTRDSSMVINNQVFIGNMANSIRIAEAIIMSHIFRAHSDLCCEDFLVDATKENLPHATFEGGDILILREDTMLIGMSERTSAPGIDYMIEQFKKGRKIKHVFVVMLPKIRATIHLDMIFTMIDHDKAVVYPPLILGKDSVDIIHINLSDPNLVRFKRFPYLLKALKTVDINLEPVFCGGAKELHQKREQWQSGANFFTIGPGKIIGYGMNVYTFEELAKAGLPRVEAKDVIDGKVDLNAMNKYAVAISGNELTRGGGGCRCMTMPILREV